MTYEVSPAQALAALDPGFWDSLSPAERAVALFDESLWIRPNQMVPDKDFRTFGICAGRGFGKTHGIAYWINYCVERGDCKAPALIAPTEDRVRDVQVANLVAMSTPWFRAEEYRGSVRWPNGVVAETFTPEAPGRSRSGNFDMTWMTELVDWQPETTRLEAFNNLATATRIGRAQILWDTTSQGKNEVIQHLQRECLRDPAHNILHVGTSFDNPMLSKKYLRALVTQYVEGSRRYQEEVEGKIFAESAGALWQQCWIDTHRRVYKPSDSSVVIVSLDPSLSAHTTADEAGICVASRDRSGHVDILEDHSGRMTPEQWATIVFDRCMLDAAGFVYERNHAGDMPRDLVKLKARAHNVTLVEITEVNKPIPARKHGVIYWRGVISHKNKAARAEPAAELYRQGQVHHAKVHDLLELEQTTWEPSGSKSPNRLDACAQAVTELLGVHQTESRKAVTPQALDRLQRAAADLRSAIGGRGSRRI